MHLLPTILIVFVWERVPCSRSDPGGERGSTLPPSPACGKLFRSSRALLSQQGGWSFYFCPACPKIVVLSFPGAAKYFTGCLVSWRGIGSTPSPLPELQGCVFLAEVFQAQPVRASHHRVFKVLKRWNLLTVREIKETFRFQLLLSRRRSAREGLGAGWRSSSLSA